jgi:chromate transport protein ChrA
MLGHPHAMFESVAPDPGADGLRRAAKIFRVIAVLLAIGTVLLTVTNFRLVRLIVNAILAIVAWVTAQGIDDQRSWARWLGFTFAFLALFSIPIGTIAGIAAFVYLGRASRAGLFR